MGRGSPIRDSLVAYLTSVLDNCKNKGTPIPTVHKMAAENKVAYQTMWRAVNQCRTMGILTVAPRRGIRYTDTAARSEDMFKRSIPDDYSPTKKWLLVRDLLRRELMQGGFSGTPKLPSIKILCQRFGACYPVVRRALQSMVFEGIIELCEGGYCTTRISQRSTEDSIALVSGVVHPGPHYGRVFARNLDILRALESSCSASHIRLRLVEQPSNYRQLRTQSNLEHTRGFIVWAQGMNPNETIKIVSDLSLSGLPVATLDENGTLVCRGADSLDSLVQQFRLGVKADSGRDVGTYLRELGHRRVAYFSTLENNSRLDGLREALVSKDSKDPVCSFIVNEFKPREGHSIPGVFTQKGPSGIPYHLWQSARSELEPHAIAAFHGASHALALEESFSKALTDKTITAWVGANDLIAIQCLRYLHRKEINVPRQLAVIGFDDTTEATFHSLSSYNFNVHGLANAIIQHLLHPRLRRDRHGIPKVWEVPGYVNARASTDHIIN